MAKTIKDLAYETGLGIATISRYINHIPVKQQNKEKIEKAIIKLNYTKNEYARALKMNSSKSVGLIFPRIDDVFGSLLIALIQKKLSQLGYSIMLVTTENDYAKERQAVNFLVSRRVDGIIAIPMYPTDGAYSLVVDNEIPIVFLDSEIDLPNTDSIYVDNKRLIQLAVDKLVSLHHTKIGFICGIEGAFSSDLRHDAFVKSLQKYKITLDKNLVIRGGTDEKSGYENVKKLFTQEDKPTAIICSNYDLTIGAIIYFNEKQIVFPRDISFVGIDNISLAKVIRPKLTMVSQNYDSLADKAVCSLIERLENKNAISSRRFILDVTFIEGQSVCEL